MCNINLFHVLVVIDQLLSSSYNCKQIEVLFFDFFLHINIISIVILIKVSRLHMARREVNAINFNLVLPFVFELCNELICDLFNKVDSHQFLLGG